jgi:nicotinamidase-related amidase
VESAPHPHRPVFMSMDFQRAMCDPDGAVGRAGLAGEIARRGTLERLATTLAAVRSAEVPVVHVRVAFDPDYSRMTSASPRFAAFRDRRMLTEDADESQFVHAATPLDGEPVIDKGCVNQFVGTRLLALLVSYGCNHLILAGVATNHVVEGTARYAADHGFRVTVVDDCCAGASAEMHAFSVERILPFYGEVVASFDATQLR